MKKIEIRHIVNTTEQLSKHKALLDGLKIKFDYDGDDGLFADIVTIKVTTEEKKTLIKAINASLDMINEALKQLGERVNGTSKTQSGSTNTRKRRAPISKSKRNRKSAG